MRFPRIGSVLAAFSLIALSGCGYVHFGRLPAPPAATRIGDEQLLQENAGLRT